MRNLYEIIQSCKDGNEEDVIFILNKFDPLINKYSRLLEYEDTKQELSLTLIKVLQRIRIDKGNFTEDKYIISYIKKSIINRYIALSKQLSKVSRYESEADINLIYADNDEDVLEMCDLLKDLTEIERKVIILKYMYMMKDSEIAILNNISRQAVNQAKNRAISKLRLYFKKSLNIVDK